MTLENFLTYQNQRATEYFPTKLMDSEVWTFPVTDKGIVE